MGDVVGATASNWFGYFFCFVLLVGHDGFWVGNLEWGLALLPLLFLTFHFQGFWLGEM